MKKLELIRFANFDDRTIGRLTIDNHSFYTIENPCLDNKAFISCIPVGEYRMIRVDSPKYGAGMWEISNVPGRSHILIHVANTAKNVTGCVGMGSGLYGDLEGVASSRIAIDRFYDLTKGYEAMDIIIRRGEI